MAIVNTDTEKFIVKVNSPKEWWTNTYSAGDKVPVSGIYKCKGCKKEITSNKNDPFPPENHHQHTALAGEIEWKLIVRTDTEGNDCGL